MRHHANNRLPGVDVGARAELAPHAIRDGILDLQPDEPRVVVLAVAERRLDHERRGGSEMLFPGHARRRIVQTLGPVHLEFAEGM